MIEHTNPPLYSRTQCVLDSDMQFCFKFCRKKYREGQFFPPRIYLFHSISVHLSNFFFIRTSVFFEIIDKEKDIKNIYMIMICPIMMLRFVVQRALTVI